MGEGAASSYWKTLTVIGQKRNKEKIVKSHYLVQRVWKKSQDLPEWVHLPCDFPCSALHRSRELCRFEVFPKLELHQALGANTPLGNQLQTTARGCLAQGSTPRSGVWVCARDQ